MQIYGLQADICCLKFVDRGFYVNTSGFDLALLNNLEDFSKNMVKWVQQLLKFKMCVNVASISTQGFSYQQATFLMYSNWITGPFLPPTKDGSILPKQTIKGAADLVKPSINRAFVYYNQKCVSVKAWKETHDRNSLSAFQDSQCLCLALRSWLSLQKPVNPKLSLLTIKPWLS